MSDELSRKEKVIAVAQMMRLGQMADANACLPGVMTEIYEEVIRLTPEQLEQARPILDGIRICQENQDWLGMADYLEYEMPVFFSEVTS